MKTLHFIPVLIVLTFFACLATAATRHVPAEYPTIQSAINDCNHGDTVIVEPNTYTGPGNRDIDFKGLAITVRSTDPCDPDVVAATVIYCNGTESEPHRGFYFHNGETQTSILEGMTITNGWQTEGGVIYCDGSSPTISNCVIRDNSISGIVCDDGSDATISDCTIITNDGDGIYYGIYCRFSNVAISNCTIQDNKDDGICYNASDGTISDCTISGNDEDGIRFDQWCNVVITGCAIRNNKTGVDLGYTDGIVIESCKVEGNTQSAIRCGNTNIIIDNCWIIGNFASEGGGIHCWDAAPTIKNCLVANNVAEDGGGIYCDYESEPKMVNCVIVNNEAFNYGGGVYSEYESNPTISNCVIWGNTADYGNQVALCSNGGLSDTSQVTVSYSDIQGGGQAAYIDVGCTLNWGEGMIDVDPSFAFEADYHLAGGSPCVDAGTNSPSGGLPAVGLDGNLRPLDGNGDSNSIADIGVYEFNTQKPTIALSAESVEFFIQENRLDPNDQILSIRNAGGSTLTWEILEDCNWLEAIPASGTSRVEVNDVVLNVNAGGLTHGDYICELTVEDEQAINHPQVVVITLHINKTLHGPPECNSIQAVIDAAVDGDVVLVADGTYTGDGNRDIDLKGKAITVTSENGPDACIIDCEGQGGGFYLHNKEDNTSIIRGFTITNGYLERPGSGIQCSRGSSPIIENCVINRCTSEIGGGGIYCGYRTSVQDCIIKGNKGGVACIYGEAMISNCTVTENYDRPGILCAMGRPTIEHSTISKNNCGIVLAASSKAIIKDCIISANIAKEEHNYGIGAGIFCGTGSSPTISSAVIVGNFAEFGGGGICCNLSSPKINNCTIAHNKAGICGGGIWVFSNCYPAVSNCILWGNTAEIGNQIAQEHPDYPGDSIVSVSYCDVQGGEAQIFAGYNHSLDWGLGNIEADPCFVAAGYWDANSTPDDANGDFWVDSDYHLKSEGWRWNSKWQEWDFDRVTSRCIDAGNPGSPLVDELLSVPDDPNNQWGENLRINMGAYGGTSQASMPPYDWALLADITNNGIVDYVDLAGQAQDWLITATEQPGDLNRDGMVNITDFAMLAEEWLSTTSWETWGQSPGFPSTF